MACFGHLGDYYCNNHQKHCHYLNKTLCHILDIHLCLLSFNIVIFLRTPAWNSFLNTIIPYIYVNFSNQYMLNEAISSTFILHNCSCCSFYSYKISFLPFYLVLLLVLPRIFGNALFLFVLNILVRLQHLYRLHTNLLVFRKLLLLFVLLLSLLVDLLLRLLYKLNKLH